MNQDEQGKKMGKLIAKAWADEGFKQKLLADPAATLKAEGVVLPAGRSIKTLADDDQVLHLVIPAKPTDLSDEDLEKVAGGMGNCVGGAFCFRYKQPVPDPGKNLYEVTGDDQDVLGAIPKQYQPGT
jgi:hypothetical protein